MEEDFLADKQFIKKNLDVCLSLDDSGRTRRGLQHMSVLKMKSKKAQAFFQTLMSHAYKAESTCPGSGMIFLSLALKNNRKFTNSYVKTRQDLYDALKNLDISSIAYDMLMSALDLCTTSSKLTIKKSTNNKAYIEATDGYSFNVNALLKIQPVDLQKTYTVCIDGYVESVSEIHHLLTFASEAKLPCLIFSRGMSEDVLHTLKVNMDRKTLLAYPYAVPFDLENVNTIVDLAVVSGTDVVSSLKGELISSTDVNKLGRVDNCILTASSIRLRCDATRKRVEEHVNFIKKTIEERKDVEEILSKRLKSLSASCIDICIPDDMNFYSTSQQLDEGIRVIITSLKMSYDPQRVAKEMHETYLRTVENTHNQFLLDA